MEIVSYFETAQYFFHAVTLFRINQVFFQWHANIQAPLTIVGVERLQTYT